MGDEELGPSIGLCASYVALVFGGFYFIFALKYYISTIIALIVLTRDANRVSSILKNEMGNSENIQGLPIDPFISIHLPFFNEINVARRVIQACIDLDYTNYEILVADDSVDDTIQIMKNREWRITNPIIKFVHRKDRTGFKGGALQAAQKYMHPQSKFVMVFDADFVPPPTIIHDFLNHYRKVENSGKPVAAVQGYQLHYLNKTENWVTKGVRAEFSGSYMVERVAEEVFGAMKMISGSVFLLSTEVLKTLGWTTSITEDWELTLRLYLEGYRVVYTPLIQAPAEIPNTLTKIARQRMRWAEGHTYAVKKYFWKILISNKLTISEKLEFLYFTPYYLQSFFFIIGTLSLILSEIFRQRPAFWTPTLGWGLIISNFFAIPLMGLAGLFLEGDLREDYSGIFSFIAISYFITPYQAYAALKGLFEGEEGNWIRTLKTGNITDNVFTIKFRSFIKWLRKLRGDNLQRITEGSRTGVIFLTKKVLIVTCFILIALPFTDAFIQIFRVLGTELTDYLLFIIGVRKNG